MAFFLLFYATQLRTCGIDRYESNFLILFSRQIRKSYCQRRDQKQPGQKPRGETPGCNATHSEFQGAHMSKLCHQCFEGLRSSFRALPVSNCAHMVLFLAHTYYCFWISMLFMCCLCFEIILTYQGFVIFKKKIRLFSSIFFPNEI